MTTRKVHVGYGKNGKKQYAIYQYHDHQYTAHFQNKAAGRTVQIMGGFDKPETALSAAWNRVEELCKEEGWNRADVKVIKAYEPQAGRDYTPFDKNGH